MVSRLRRAALMTARLSPLLWGQAPSMRSKPRVSDQLVTLQPILVIRLASRVLQQPITMLKM